MIAPSPPPLTQERLEAMVVETRQWLQQFTDPPTATIEMRALEVVAALEELVAWRRGAR